MKSPINKYLFVRQKCDVPTPSQIRAYLYAKGWKYERTINRMEILSLRDVPYMLMPWHMSDRYAISVCFNSKKSDYNKLCTQLVEQLSHVESIIGFHKADPFSRMSSDIANDMLKYPKRLRKK